MENDPIHSITDTVTQVSVLSALFASQFDGHLPCRELLKYGDFGIGTFDRMEGEMIFLDGTIYQGKADGQIYTPDLSIRTPFATVCRFRSDQTWEVAEPVDREALEGMIDEQASNQNVFCAIRVEGTFSHVQTHALQMQSKPYPPTSEVIKSVVHSEMHDVAGTIVGFRCPAFVKGINDPGYHLHFLTDDKAQGGHLLSFVMDRGTCAIDICSNHFVILPEGGAPLAGVELSSAEK